MQYRTEHDLLGTLDVPADVYWGIHTQRAKANFVLTGEQVRPSLIRAIALVKKACCLANRELGYLDEAQSNAVVTACDEIAGGGLSDQFPLDAQQGGAGTSTNMNLNEVIANRALELRGRARGDGTYLHPLDHINLHQSTNDVYPTALKIAAIFGVRTLSRTIAGLQDAFQQKEREFSGIVTIGRTEMMDAVPITLGAQFGSFAEACARDRWRAFKCEERLRTVTIGGTAVGTGLAAPRGFIFLAIEKLRAVTGLGLTRAENPLDLTANADPCAEVAGILAAHAANQIKIAGDLRLLHSLGEIVLPPVQAGSSMMPGKINPVVAEAAMSAGMQARMHCWLVNETASRGTLQINEFMPLLAHHLLGAIELLTASSRMMADHVEHITACPAVCREHAGRSTTLITAFLPQLGYERAQALVKEFAAGGAGDFRRFLESKLGAECVASVLSPENIMALGYRPPARTD
jgi:aspartate ammonia-lyase